MTIGEFLENYQVYEDGKVQRVTKPKGMRKDSGYFLKPESCKNGYQRITLCHKGKTKRFLLHRLVALVHIPNPDNLPCINHKDGNPQNNHISNLEWCSHSYNEQWSYDHLDKKAAHGEEHYQAKLTTELVREIRNKGKVCFKNIANELGVSLRTIRDAYNKKTWKHII